MFNFMACKKGKKKKRIQDFFVFPTMFFEGEDGAGGGVPEGGTDGSSSDVALLDGIPESALESDSELREMLAEEKSASSKRGVSDKGPDVDQGSDGESDSEVPGTDVDKLDSENETPVDDKNSDEDQLDDIEFADNVIEGLSGADLKKLPVNALEALVAYVEKHKNVSGEASKATERLNQLLADPIVRRREELLKSGKTDYEVRGLNATEKQSIINSLKERLGLDSGEAEVAFDVLKGGIDSAAKDAAKDVLQNMILEDSNRRQQDEVTKKGRGNFLALGKFNKDFQFNETDPNKFWKVEDGKNVLNEAHPEAAKFREKVLPVMNALSKVGLGYQHIANMSEKAVYALAAEQLGLSVAFNTQERDKKMVASELRKKLSPFIKGNGSGELSVKGGANVADGRSKAVIKHGYDIERLATDGKYYERALTEKAGNSQHMALVESLADEGEEYIAKKQKPKK